jgi:hypothetical protein
MAEIKEGAPVSRRPDEPDEHDSIREDTQRKGHEDRDRGPVQEEGEAPPLGFDLVSQPIENGRQPSRPGQPGRWEKKPGDRDQH